MTTPSSYTPAYEAASAAVAALRADPYLGSLLFPSWSPSVDAADKRVYQAAVQLPEIPAVREALPRVLVEGTWIPAQWEQDSPTLNGPVNLYVHVIVPKEQLEHGDRLAAALISKLLSTQLSGARIIAAGLYLANEIVPWARIAAFNEAFECVITFRSQNVGVLA